MKLVVIFMVLLMAAVPCSQGQKRVTETEELIRGLESKLTVAILQGDSTSVERILADDYIEINAQGLLRMEETNEVDVSRSCVVDCSAVRSCRPGQNRFQDKGYFA